MKANRRPPSKDKAKVVLDITMSVDGYVAGPNVDAQRPLGEGGERLHDWAFGGKPDNRLPIGHYPKAATDADVLAELRKDDTLAAAQNGSFLEKTLLNSESLRFATCNKEPWKAKT